MIQSIRLVNWRSHKDTHLEFSRGTNLLVGIMGGGKSSVLEAASFALFGTFPALERRRLKLDDVVRFNEERAAVSLFMDWDGNKYRIERTIEKKEKRTATKAEIFRGGSLIETGPSAVTTYVEQLLGIDYDLFTRAIYSEQNNIDYFLSLDPSRRKEEIDRLLGLDRFEEARGNIVSVINRVESNRKLLEERYDPKVAAETKEGVETYHAEAVRLKARIESVTKELEAETKIVREAEERFAAVRQEKEKYERLETEITRIRGMAESIESEIEPDMTEEVYKMEIAGLEALRAELAEVQAKNQAIETEKSGIARELGSVQEQIRAEAERKAKAEGIEKELAALLEGKRADDFRAELGLLEEKLLRLGSERKAIEDEMADAADLLKKVKPGMDGCPLCGTKLDQHGIEHIKREKNALIERKRKRMKEVESEAGEAKARTEMLRARVKKLESALERKEGYLKEKKDTAALESRRKKLGEEIAGMEASIGKNQETISGKRKSYEKLVITVEKCRKSVENRRKLSLLREKEAELKEKKGKIRYDERIYEDARVKLEDARVKKQKSESEKNAAGQQLRMAADMETSLRRRMEEIEESRRMATHFSKLGEELKIYRNALLDTQVSLRKNLIEAINAAMGEIWGIFYPYKNYAGVRLEVTEKDYLFEVYERGEWKSLETVASGGERACAALTLRVALATVLTPNLSWLILDEPTHNLDKEAVGLLSETLQLKVPQVVNQTFVITHEEGLVGADFAASYKLTRNKETDGPTEVERI